MSLDRDRLAGRFRFVHIDGGHAYEVVREDILTARRLLAKGGVVVFDHWSQPQCRAGDVGGIPPGKLIPLCLTSTKLYATWDSGASRPYLDEWAAAQSGIEVSYACCLAGREVRSYVQKKADGLRLGRPVARSPESALRRALRQIAPPILARWGRL
jgi:hypothetical protein